MVSQPPIHDNEPSGYSTDDFTLASRGHDRSMSTANLLQNDEFAQAQTQTQAPGYDTAYRPPFAHSDYAYDPTGYSTDTLADKSGNSYALDAVPYGKSENYRDKEYSEPFSVPPPQPPLKSPNPFQRYFGLYPLEQRITDKQRGVGVQSRPYVVWALTLAMLGILVYELVVNDKAQGTPVSFKPVVNPMLGPSESALINLGARFPACMKNVSAIPLTTQLACLNDTANPVTEACPLEDICGFGGFHDKTPNQWFRFITPIFLHAGIVHYLLNMLAQMTVSAQVEREMGSVFFIVLYMASGIFGNVLGGNFALVGVPSVGASGAIFGTTAISWIDLLAHWRYTHRPGTRLVWLIVELIVGIGLGFIPYVDNFAHLGGLLMGLLVGMAFYPIISPSSRHRAIVIAFRLTAIPLAIVLYVVLVRNFFTSDPYAACSWCRYLSCIPTSSNDHCKGTGLSTSSSF